jgi:hypothetical protein
MGRAPPAGPRLAGQLASVTGGTGEGRRLEASGRLDEAEAVYLRWLKERPGDVLALNLLGLLCHRRGRHSEAAELIAGPSN